MRGQTGYQSDCEAFSFNGKVGQRVGLDHSVDHIVAALSCFRTQTSQHPVSPERI